MVINSCLEKIMFANTILYPNFLIKFDEIRFTNGEVYRSEREKPLLKIGTVPSIIPGAPKSASKKITIRVDLDS